jgi:hypothetical protein
LSGGLVHDRVLQAEDRDLPEVNPGCPDLTQRRVGVLLLDAEQDNI